MEITAISNQEKSSCYIIKEQMQDFIDKFVIIIINNTRHAFRKICAPWRVTCFWGL